MSSPLFVRSHCTSSPSSASSSSPPTTPSKTTPPSSPALLPSGTSSPSSPPASSSNKGGRRRDPKAIPRPRNAFFLFRIELGTRLPQSVEHDNRHICKIAGMTWNAMPKHEKKYWYDRAAEEKAAHALAHPDYHYRPRPTQPKRKRAVRRNGKVDLERDKKVAQLVLKGMHGGALAQEVRKLDKDAEVARDVSDKYTTAVFHLELSDQHRALGAAPAERSALLPGLEDLLLSPADASMGFWPPGALTLPPLEPGFAPAQDAPFRAPPVRAPPLRAAHPLTRAQTPLMHSVPLPDPAAAAAASAIDPACWDVDAFDAFMRAQNAPQVLPDFMFAAPPPFPQWVPAQAPGTFLEPQLVSAPFAQGAYGSARGASGEDLFALGLGLGGDALAPEPAMDLNALCAPLDFSDLQWAFPGM
ncbi:hypothetical protein B0H21DRAFT_736269 [Amylocystis lapponica]|nr:hypothetical protein B0H21DRAFT_736269 [Amylocystis lapponica]